MKAVGENIEAGEASIEKGGMRAIFARAVRYMALLRGHSEFAHSSAGSYPMYRGGYVYGYPFAPYGGGVSPTPSRPLPRGAAVAAADATALARRVQAFAAVVMRQLYVAIVATAFMAGAASVASATDTARSLAAAAPRTIRTVLWAVRASLSYKRFQVRYTFWPIWVP